MAKNDLSKMSLAELQALSKDINKEVERRRAEEIKDVISQMNSLAATVGMTPKQILSSAGSKKKSKSAVKYRNPDNPEQTWTGRGPRPRWMKDALESGKTLDDFAV